VNSSYELFKFLKQKVDLSTFDKYWWPEAGTFTCLISTILGQNTRWQNANKSIENLKKLNLLSLEKLSSIPKEELIQAITPSGFKNQKSKYIQELCKNIMQDFGDFETFKASVSRDWLLEQKGIGPESADGICAYVCFQDEMVVDKYTNNLLKSFDYEFESYDELKAWLEYGINENYDKIKELYGSELSLNEIYCKFHGKIVEYMKKAK